MRKTYNLRSGDLRILAAHGQRYDDHKMYVLKTTGLAVGPEVLEYGAIPGGSMLWECYYHVLLYPVPERHLIQGELRRVS